MNLYPFTFQPIFKSMLWGGRRLPDFLGVPAPHDDPLGEAWMLSDVEGNLSTIANGPLAGQTLRSVLERHAEAVFGSGIPADGRFPLLLKFIDARQELSVQVHPNDEQAERMVGPGKKGKTEAWVVLAADAEKSRIYAGFRPGVTAEKFRSAMAERTTPHTLHSFTPKPGDCVFLRAGTVHAIGAEILLFEVQQTSDTTYRLYDWDRVDAKTGKPRQLHIDEGLHCSDFAAGPCEPVAARRVNGKDELVNCEYFGLHHHSGQESLTIGEPGSCRVVVVIDGSGTLASPGHEIPLREGSVVLLPAAVGSAEVIPNGSIRVLECGVN